MTVGGISSSLNSTLARLSSIESNFQALNSVAFEIDLKQNSAVQNYQNSDFKTILDGKLKNIENKIEQPQEEEIEPVELGEEIEAAPAQEENAVSQDNPQIQEISNITPDKQADEKTANTEVKFDISTNEIKEEPISLKSKISLKKQSTDINEIIETFSNKYGIDADFVKAIIKQESGFNPKATSKKGAMGLMQLMPATAKSLGVNNAYNPQENLEGGIKYLKGLLNRYNNNQELALAAYNAGSGAVKKYGGVPPYKETQNYVKSIMAAYTKAKEAKI